MKPKPLSERLHELLRLDPATGCLEFQGPLGRGYGRIAIGGRGAPAHRVAYELAKGPIPPGLVIDHLCRNRRCCNPDHLEPVTNRENILRGIGLSALNAKKTHCLRGHPFDAENTGIQLGYQRYCLRCAALARKRSRQRAKERPHNEHA